MSEDNFKQEKENKQEKFIKTGVIKEKPEQFNFGMEKREKAVWEKKNETEIKEEENKNKEVASAHSSSALISASDEEREKKIEMILEKDLADIYASLSIDKQREIKIIGEKTAQEINTLLGKAKIKVKKIINLIRKWLYLIPGVNKFFVEQEVKIKTDEIMKLNNTKNKINSK